MPTTAQLLRFIEDELSRATPMAERVQAGTLQLLRDPHGATPAGNERAATFELTEALQRRGTAFRDGFVTALHTRVMAELAASQAHALPDGHADLELMDESRVLVDIEISRAVQLIDTTAEWELRELQTFTSTLGGQAHVSAESNPLRPSVFAAALWDATAALGDSQSLRFAVLRVAAGVLAGLLKNEWAAACSRLEAQGIEPGTYRTVVLKPGAGPARAEVDVTQPGALQGLLSRMPAAESNALAGETTPAASTSEAPGRRDTVDGRIVELLARLFEAILSDAELPPAFRTMIARLQAAALRVALQDRAMLDTQDHPVWRLMDRIARAGSGHPSGSDPRGRALLEACEQLTDDVARAEAPDAATFRNALARLDAHLARAFQAERDAAQAAVEALEHKERRGFLGQQLSQRLAEQMAPVHASASIRRFVTGTWAQVLAESFMRFGERTSPTPELLQTVDDLMWSLHTPDHPQSRQRLLALLPGLLQRLRSGMALIALPSAEQQAVLDELMAIHTEALRPKGRAGEAALTPQQLVQQLRDEVVPAGPPMRPFGDSVIDLASMDTVPMDMLTPGAAAQRDEPAQRIEAMGPGDWARLFLAGRWARVQLLWRSERGQYFLFTGEAAGRTHSITRRALERLGEAGLVKPLTEQPLVQRAVDLLLRRLALPL